MSDSRITFKIPTDLHHRAKIRAAQDNVTIAALLRGWLMAWLAGELQAPTKPPPK